MLFLYAALCAALALPVGAVAAPVSLSLEEAQRMALARSRQLASHDHAAAAAREMAVAAGQLPDPVLKAGIDNLPVSGDDRLSLTKESMTMRRIGVMQEITGADKRQLRAARYELDRQKSLVEKQASSAGIERDTAIAWLDRYYLEAMTAAVGEQLEQAKLELIAAEGEYRGGRGKQADILGARSVLALLEDSASEFSRKLKNARLILARWVGEAAEAPLAARPPISQVRFSTATLDAELASHPALSLSATQERLADTNVKLAQANRRADWTVEVAYQQRGSAYDNMVSVGLSIPLQWDRKRRQDRELASSLAMVEQTRAEREETRRALVAETQAMLNEWESNRERLARYEQTILPLAASRIDAVAAAYRGGKASLPDLLGARRNAIEQRLQALQLEADTARVWAQLNFLLPSATGMSETAKDKQ